MDLRIEISDNVGAALQAQAQAHGLSAARYVSRLVEKALLTQAGEREEHSDKPFETGYGMWAKYGPAPSAEEIDNNRREMFRNFAQE